MQEGIAATFELIARAKLPIWMVSRIFGVSRETIYTWKSGRRPLSEAREKQRAAFHATLEHHLEKGTLPVSQNELMWWGLVHITQCKD